MVIADSDFDLCDPDDERCPNPARFRWHCVDGYIPLCAMHYDIWCQMGGVHGEPGKEEGGPEHPWFPEDL